MLYPKYDVSLGSKTLKPDDSLSVISVRTGTKIGAPEFYAEVVLRLDKDNRKDFVNGSPLKISIGYDQKLNEVFTGIIDSLNIEFNKITILGLGSLSVLSNLHLDRFYENSNAKEIISDIVTSAGNLSSMIEEGIDFPYYAIDSNKNTYEHILELCYLSGIDFFSSFKNEVICKKFVKDEKKHVLEYGKDVMKVMKFDPNSFFSSISVSGESPSDSKGAEASHWITKSPPNGKYPESAKEGQVESQPSEFKIQRKVIKDKDTATKVAKNIFEKTSEKNSIEVEILGNSDIGLDDTVYIQKCPIEDINKIFRVVGIYHYLDKISGFRSILNMMEIHSK